MLYNPTLLEIAISNILIGQGIICISDMTISKMSKAFGIEVFFLPVETCISINKKTTIILNSNKSGVILYEEFLHEIAHFILEHQSILAMDERMYQYCEMKANNIVQYLAMPYFLLDIIMHLNNAKKMAEYFYCSVGLAEKRLENIRNREVRKVYENGISNGTIREERQSYVPGEIQNQWGTKNSILCFNKLD